MTQADEKHPHEWAGERPNYTQIPNALLDRGHDLSNAAFRVVCVVLRRTRGWHRENDLISLSQIERQTGMTRKTVMTAIDEAIRLKWIARAEVMTDRGLSYVYEFRIAEDSTSGEIPPVEKFHLKQWRNSTATSGEIPPLPVEKLHTQKKGKKERKKGKENSLARASRGAGADASSSISERLEAQPQQAATTPVPEQPRADSTLADEPVVPNPEAAKRVRKVRQALSEHEAARHRELFDGLTAICVVDAKLMGGRIARTAKQLREADPTAVRATMDEFLAWWKTSDFRGQRGKPPTLDQVVTSWKLFRENYGERPAAKTTDKAQKGAQYIDRLARIYTEVIDDGQ